MPKNFLRQLHPNKAKFVKFGVKKSNLATLFMPCSFLCVMNKITYGSSMMLQVPAMCFSCCADSLYIARAPNTFRYDPKK